MRRALLATAAALLLPLASCGAPAGQEEQQEQGEGGEEEEGEDGEEG